MLDILLLIAPVFGLIALGTLFGKLGFLSETAEKGIGEFAFTLAIPALLLKTVATSDFSGLSIAGVWASFYIAAAVTWLAATAATAWPLARPAQDAPSIAIASAFGNSVMLGIPIAFLTFGEASSATVALILSIHAPSLWLAATLHARLVATPADGETPPSMLEVLRDDLGRNPVVIGVLLGAAWRLTGVPMPKPALDILTLLAQAGVPAALVALGLSLTRFRIAGQIPTLATITVLKLVAMPVVAMALAYVVFGLSPVSAGTVAILSAVPTGANAYIFATRSGRAVNSASGAIALGTIVSALTISLLLAVITR
ncbi:MAG: AEC family transporter [Hyphomicrobiaceae bacterium]|nr:AEC family transporter [Hyphomicrobiaceae bacterium]